MNFVDAESGEKSQNQFNIVVLEGNVENWNQEENPENMKTAAIVKENANTWKKTFVPEENVQNSKESYILGKTTQNGKKAVALEDDAQNLQNASISKGNDLNSLNFSFQKENVQNIKVSSPEENAQNLKISSALEECKNNNNKGFYQQENFRNPKTITASENHSQSQECNSASQKNAKLLEKKIIASEDLQSKEMILLLEYLSSAKRETSVNMEPNGEELTKSFLGLVLEKYSMLEIVVFRFIRSLQFLLFIVMWPYSTLASFMIKKKSVPPISNQLLLYKASELAHLIRSQKITSTEVVRAYIERIKTVEPIINAVVQERFDEALLEAKRIDEMLHENNDIDYWASTKPLLGVPISFKETVAVAGMSNNGGRCVPSERIAVADCQAVRCLKEAGAIPLVVTNTPELCLFWESYNNSKGRTNNPYNTQRTAGGSSGGECALMSSGGSLIGLGSDIAGSGRLPAMFCGTCGHKPTSRIVSVDSHMPDSTDPEWDRFLTLAPLARYASDLALVLRNAAPKEKVAALNLDKEVDLKNLKIYFMEDCNSHLIKRVCPDIREAIRKSAMHFKKFGIEPQKVSINNFDRSLEATIVLMLNMKSPTNVFQKSDDPEDWTVWDVWRALFRKMFFCSDIMAYTLAFGFLKKLAECASERRVEAMKNLKSKISRNLEEMLGDDGVLLLPVFTDPAHKHYRMYYKLLNSVYLAFFNLTELPATVCPLGLGKEGLPIGIQIVANKHQDRLCLAVACELERAFGGWVPPPGGVQTTSIMV